MLGESALLGTSPTTDAGPPYVVVMTRQSLARIAVVLPLVLTACVLSGLYGAIHNQISYTVAPEYFTQFKFEQFRIPPAIPHRLGAAMVGWQAAFGMGGIVALCIVPAAMRQPRVWPVVVASLRGFAIVTGVTLAVGLLALAFAWLTLTPENVGEVQRYGNAIEDDVAFWRAGTMHNFSYLGGVIGGIVGCVMTCRLRRGDASSAAATGTNDDPDLADSHLAER